MKYAVVFPGMSDTVVEGFTEKYAAVAYAKGALTLEGAYVADGYYAYIYALYNPDRPFDPSTVDVADIVCVVGIENQMKSLEWTYPEFISKKTREAAVSGDVSDRPFGAAHD